MTGEVDYQWQFTNLVKLLLNGGGGELLEGLNGDVRDDGVESGGSIISGVVTETGATNTDAVGDLGDASGPHVLVEAVLDTDIGSAHVDLSELLDGLKSTGSALLHNGLVKTLLQVDGEITGNNIGGVGLHFLLD
eukprot:TRINITY_DN86956_c0_g1_i1.p1 TRINITY_DN86956_c0_g1~~TRINITY_DN86956_c0_g1_i1.p1  ORF type:complete len:135 (-),score=11.38 TRINITY_DN86956_c0_g1_i1:6-410(-)